MTKKEILEFVLLSENKINCLQEGVEIHQKQEKKQIDLKSRKEKFAERKKGRKIVRSKNDLSPRNLSEKIAANILVNFE